MKKNQKLDLQALIKMFDSKSAFEFLDIVKYFLAKFVGRFKVLSGFVSLNKNELYSFYLSPDEWKRSLFWNNIIVKPVLARRVLEQVYDKKQKLTESLYPISYSSFVIWFFLTLPRLTT